MTAGPVGTSPKTNTPPKQAPQASQSQPTVTPASQQSPTNGGSESSRDTYQPSGEGDETIRPGTNQLLASMASDSEPGTSPNAGTTGPAEYSHEGESYSVSEEQRPELPAQPRGFEAGSETPGAELPNFTQQQATESEELENGSTRSTYEVDGVEYTVD